MNYQARGKICIFVYVLNWPFKQPTCSKRLMESCSTFFSKRSSSGVLNTGPSLGPYSGAMLLNKRNKAINPMCTMRYLLLLKTTETDEKVKKVKEGH